MESKLVGSFNHLEKYARQLGLLFPIYGKKKFQTTNQQITDHEWHFISLYAPPGAH
jgi:hypothetical protein